MGSRYKTRFIKDTVEVYIEQKDHTSRPYWELVGRFHNDMIVGNVSIPSWKLYHFAKAATEGRVSA